MNQLARRLWVVGGSDFGIQSGWCVVGVGVSYLTTVIVAGALCTHEIRPIDKQCKQNSGHKKYTPTHTHTSVSVIIATKSSFPRARQKSKVVIISGQGQDKAENLLELLLCAHVFMQPARAATEVGEGSWQNCD